MPSQTRSATSATAMTTPASTRSGEATTAESGPSGPPSALQQHIARDPHFGLRDEHVARASRQEVGNVEAARSAQR